MATLYVNKSGKSNPTTAGMAFIAVEVSGITNAPTSPVNYTMGSTYTLFDKQLTGVAPNISGVLWFYRADTTLPANFSGTMSRSGGGIGDATIAYSAYYRVGTTTMYPSSNIQDIIAYANTGDNIIVGSGIYSERLTMTIGSRYLSFFADGVVILDGTGLAGTGSAISITYLQAASTTSTTQFTTYVNGGKWIIRNYNVSSATTGVVYIAGIATSATGVVTLYLHNVELYGNVNNSIGISSDSAARRIVSIDHCLLSGFSSYGMYAVSTGADANYYIYLRFYYSTFYNCGTHVYCRNGTAVANAYGFYNIFHTNTTAISNQSNQGVNIDYNDYYNVTHLGNVNGTNYDTLAALQAIGSELHGSIANPNLIDPANGVAYVSSQTLYGAYPYSVATQGLAYDPSSKWIITAAKDDTGWYNADGNVTKNVTTNEFELSNGVSGIIESPVYDIGSVQTITEISYVANETFPTNMIDTDKTDTKPNKQQVEVRADANSFVQASVSPSWITCNAHSLLTSPVGRYVQVKLTLRNDDVGA